MKIVDRKTFLALPDGIVASKFDGTIGELFIKEETFHPKPGFSGDFYVNSILDTVDDLDTLWETGTNPVHVDTCCRDGLFEDDEHFAIWSPEDINLLIGVLTPAIEPSTQADVLLTTEVQQEFGKLYGLENSDETR